MKILWYISLFVFVTGLLQSDAGLIEAASGDLGGSGPSDPAGLPNRTLSNINDISAWYHDDGVQESSTQGSGLTFPRQTADAMFAAGPLWGGRFLDGLSPEIRVNGHSYHTGLQRGAILGTRTGVAEDPDAPDVRIWRVRRDFDTADLTLDAAEINMIDPAFVTPEMIDAVRDQYETDWLEWPASKGAPFYDSEGDGLYDPEVIGGVPTLYPDADEPGVADGDQVLWYVCNDLTFQPWTDVQSGIEMQMTIWAYDRADAIGKVIFKRSRLLYKGVAATSTDASIEEMYVGQWADPDVGAFSDDFSGSDSARGLGYAYNGGPTDVLYSAYGLAPPAIGNDQFQGPVVYTGNSADTAIFDFRKISGAVNLPVTSFIYFAAGGTYSDPPFSADGGIQWYQMLRGLPPTPQGPPDPPLYINPVTGQPTRFWLSGDPVTGTGWNDGMLDAPGDRRTVLSSGPFSMALGDTQEIVGATVVGLGSSYLNSITVLRVNDDAAQAFFNDLVGWNFPVDVAEEEDLPGEFRLEQNYPNPFNPTTSISFTIPQSSFINLTVFDMLGREIAVVVNERLSPGTYQREWDAGGLPSGVYLYRLRAGGYMETRKLLLLR